MDEKLERLIDERDAAIAKADAAEAAVNRRKAELDEPLFDTAAYFEKVQPLQAERRHLRSAG